MSRTNKKKMISKNKKPRFSKVRPAHKNRELNDLNFLKFTKQFSKLSEE